MALPENPENRLEQYLQNIAEGSGDIPETPANRLEQYLAYIAENGGSGGSGPDFGENVGYVWSTIFNEDTRFGHDGDMPEGLNYAYIYPDGYPDVDLSEYDGNLTVILDGVKYENLPLVNLDDNYGWGTTVLDEETDLPDFSKIPFFAMPPSNSEDGLQVFSSKIGIHSLEIQWKTVGNKIPPELLPLTVEFTPYNPPDEDGYGTWTFWPATDEDEKYFMDAPFVHLYSEDIDATLVRSGWHFHPVIWESYTRNAQDEIEPGLRIEFYDWNYDADHNRHYIQRTGVCKWPVTED